MLIIFLFLCTLCVIWCDFNSHTFAFYQQDTHIMTAALKTTIRQLEDQLNSNRQNSNEGDVESIVYW